MKEKKQGKSIKKRVLRALLYGILTLLSLPLVVAFLLKQPMVQSMAARKVAGWVSEKTGDSLTIGLLEIDIFKGIEIKKLDLRDTQGFPMMRISNLKVSPAFFEFLSGKFLIHSVQMDSVDFRLIMHKGKNNYSFIRFINKLSSGDTTSKSSGVFKLNIRKLSMGNVHFQLKNENEESPDTPKNTMDYTDIEVSRASIRAHSFFLVNDSLGFKLDNLTAHEKSGLFLRKMKSDVIISGRVFSFNNTLMETNHSRINLDYTMYASGWGAYSDFVDSVRLHGVFGPTDLDLSDIGYFANVMFKMKDRTGILGGEINGPVSRITGKNLDITYGKTTRFKGDVSMAGLPDFYSTQITAKIKKFTTSVSDLKKFVIPQDNPNIPIPESIAAGEKFQLRGTFKGSYYNFITRASMVMADSGKLNFNVNLKADTSKIMRLIANFEAANFPLHHFADSSMLGNVNFTAHIAVLDTLGKQHTKLSIAIPKIQANGYNFRNINFQGRYVSDTLFTKAKINDPHLIFHISGYSVFRKKPQFHFNIKLIRSDFKPLKLWQQHDFHLSGTTAIDFSGKDINTLTGYLRMKNAVVSFGKDSYPVANIDLEKRRTISGFQSLDFTSDLLNFQISGRYRIATLGSALGAYFNRYFPVLPKKNKADLTFSDSLQINLLLKKPEFIGEHFIYGLNISPGTSFAALINLRDNTLTASGNARKIIFNNTEALDNKLEISTKNNRLQMSYGIHHLILKDSTATDKTVFGLDSLQLKLGARHDSLDYRLFWHNSDSVLINKGLLKGYYFNNRNTQQFNVSRSKVYINDTLWQVDPKNKIVYSDNAWHFHHLVIRGGLSQFALQGEFPRNNGDSLSASFRSWNLSNLDLLWHFMGFDIDGTLNGIVKITHINGRNARVADLSIDSLALNHTLLGDARILSTWDNVNNSAFIKTQVVRKGNAGRAKTVDVTGFYYPYRDSANFDLNLQFNRLKLKAINPFFNEYISDLRGTAEGEIKLRGSTGSPRILGYVDIKRASLIVNYLNTKYSFHQKILFDKDKIDFGKMTLYDTLGNSAILQGNISHHYFRDMRLNLTIQTKRLLFFNTTRHMNNVYYGTAIASGKVKITGPAEDIKMMIDATTDAGTSVVLPLDYSTEIADKDYIIFKPPPVDSSLMKPEETVLKLQPVKKSAYAITLNMNIMPSADLKIYLPSNMGDIQSKGSGILNLQVNSDGNMTLTGDYVVDKGEFNFSLGSFVKKHFELVKGGRISWAGNPYQANVNIKGLYKLKANLSSLGIVVDSSADYKNRAQVNCYVIMSHDLFNPDIKFQIHFPDLDPDMQRMVYAQLDTTNTAVMNQQMISLLVLGSFSFSNASSISWNTSYYTILSNQLSGMLSKISKDFDIGVNYKPGDAITKQEFDVALSTQLFDDRLMINGNFGMTYDKQNKSANNLVGDVDIRYKITKDGRWLLKAYNHSNDNSWYNYNNYDKVSPYTQGVGIVYRKEFTHLSDLFRRNDEKRKKKEKKGKAKKP